MTWQLKKGKTIYRFHKLVLERVDNSLECFTRATQNYMQGLSSMKNRLVFSLVEYICNKINKRNYNTLSM